MNTRPLDITGLFLQWLQVTFKNETIGCSVFISGEIYHSFDSEEYSP